MAQSEALSQHEYLANVTLARVRRYSGRPHLALHILAALRRVAPAKLVGLDRLGDVAGGREDPSTGGRQRVRMGSEPPSAIVERG